MLVARGAGAHEVDDAAVLLRDEEVEEAGHAVELGDDEGAERLAAVHRDHRLALHLPLGEAGEQVVREHRERDVVGRIAGGVHLHDRLERRVVEGEVVVRDGHGRPARAEVADAVVRFVVAVHVAVQVRASAAAAEGRQREGEEAGREAAEHGTMGASAGPGR